jgi:formate dehydrogenase iron-sulfur subunit
MAAPPRKFRNATSAGREQKKGEKPACVEACPADALSFGPRRERIEEANRRIYKDAGKYISHIYGEREVGGAGYLYLSSVPFDQIGFRTDLGTTAYPEFSKGFLYSVPIVLLLWPAFLIGVHTITKREDEVRGKEGGKR